MLIVHILKCARKLVPHVQYSSISEQAGNIKSSDDLREWGIIVKNIVGEDQYDNIKRIYREKPVQHVIKAKEEEIFTTVSYEEAQEMMNRFDDVFYGIDFN